MNKSSSPLVWPELFPPENRWDSFLWLAILNDELMPSL